MSIRYVYIPKSYRGGAMAVPRRFAEFNPVSVNYSPLVPIVSEASLTPIPITEKAANEIQNSGFPNLGKIVSYIGDSAKKAASNPDFNALMGVLAQYLIANSQGVEMEPIQQPQNKSWFRRFYEFWNLSPAQKREQELQEQQQVQQQNAAVQRRQFLSSAAPFVGRIANAYVPGSGDLVTNGLLALGRKIGLGRRKRRYCRGGAAAADGVKKKKKKKYIYIKDEATGQTLKLGLKGNFEDDVKEVARDAFTTTLSTKMEKGKAKKFVSEIFEGERLTWIANLADVFALVIGLLKPEWRVAASSVSNLVKFGDQVARNKRASNEVARKQSIADFKEHLNKELKKDNTISFTSALPPISSLPSISSEDNKTEGKVTE